MSGFVSALSTAAEAVTGIVSLSFGALGGVVLGDFAFAGFEVPDQITFGTRQGMTIHRLPGGERVIDLMGPDPADISWSGTFLDGFPVERAQTLDQMAADGAALPLVWGPCFYTVIIREFTADTRYSMVPYRISCTALRNDATSPVESDPDLTSSVNDDMASASAVAPQSDAATVTAAQTNVAAAGTLTPGSSAANSAQMAAAPASDALEATRDSSGATLSAVAADAPHGSLVGTGDDISTATIAAGDHAKAGIGASYVGRVTQNLKSSALSGVPNTDNLIGSALP